MIGTAETMNLGIRFDYIYLLLYFSIYYYYSVLVINTVFQNKLLLPIITFNYLVIDTVILSLVNQFIQGLNLSKRNFY